MASRTVVCQSFTRLQPLVCGKVLYYITGAGDESRHDIEPSFQFMRKARRVGQTQNVYKEIYMQQHDSRKARWSILLFALTLMVGSLGLAGCPEEDDDDFFRADAPAQVQQDDAGSSK